MSQLYLENLKEELKKFVENPTDIIRNDIFDLNEQKLYSGLYDQIPSFDIINNLIKEINKELNCDLRINTTVDDKNKTIHQISNGDKSFIITSHTLTHLSLLISDDLMNGNHEYVTSELLKDHMKFFVIRWLLGKQDDFLLVCKRTGKYHYEVTFDNYKYLINEYSSLELIIDYYCYRKRVMFPVSRKSARFVIQN